MRVLRKSILLFVLHLSVAILGVAQERKNVIKTNVLYDFGAYYNLSYERALSEKWSVQIGGFYLRKHQNLKDVHFSGAVTPPQFPYGLVVDEASLEQDWIKVYSSIRYYRKSFKGLYFEGMVYGENKKEDNRFDDVHEKYEISRLGVGVLAGYRFLIFKRIPLDIALGYGVHRRWFERQSDYGPTNYHKVGEGVLADISLGYLF